jgi:hypothetical protein
MPVLNVVIRGDNLSKKTMIRTERPINLSYLKLNHCYHNLDAYSLSDPTDKKQQHLLFVRFGGLLDGASKVISYIADWDEMESGSGVSSGVQRVAYDHLHGFIVGLTKHNNAGAISEKELFQVLYEDTESLEWNGEMEIEIFYLDKEGKLAKWDVSNVYNASSSKVNTSFLGLTFEYHEVLN